MLPVDDVAVRLPTFISFELLLTLAVLARKRSPMALMQRRLSIAEEQTDRLVLHCCIANGFDPRSRRQLVGRDLTRKS